MDKCYNHLLRLKSYMSTEAKPEAWSHLLRPRECKTICLIVNDDLTQYKVPQTGTLKIKTLRWSMLTNVPQKSKVSYPSQVEISNFSVLPVSSNWTIFLFPKTSSPCVHRPITGEISIYGSYVKFDSTRLDWCLSQKQDVLLHSKSIIVWLVW